jgi:hypothetical protein
VQATDARCLVDNLAVSVIGLEGRLPERANPRR